MDLAAEVFLDEAADGLDHVFGECFEDFFLVIVDADLRSCQMSRVVEHIYRVFDSHQEVIHLVELILILDHLLHKIRIQPSLPIQKPASSSLPHILLPIRHKIQLPVPIIDLL